MKIKTDTEFISFNDGICNIYTQDENDNRIDKYENLGFSNRVLGFKRYYAAAASQIQINNVIRIPQVKGINNHDTVEINNLGRYDIDFAQVLNDTNPPCIELTLKQFEMFGVES